MTEKLFQYIWQFQHFNGNELKTEQGDSVQIIEPGILNKNQGPDFLSASIKIAGVVWFGNVELHLLSSDWFRHAHHLDDNYANVILHVVWRNDYLENKMPQVPLLELQPRISQFLLTRYSTWMSTARGIPCKPQLAAITSAAWRSWTDNVMQQRLQRKAEYILGLYAQSRHDWTETFWWLLARNFGIRVNAEAFESIARTIPVKVLTRHKGQIIALESILFGQAGLLDQKFTEDYPVMLQKEFRHYRKKYQLRKTFVALKFLRMRPSSFPSIRLAQLAMLIKNSSHLFSRVLESPTLADLQTLFDVTANDYWHYHYRFEESGEYKMKRVGADMVENILINTVAPVIYGYGVFQQDRSLMARAVSLLESLPPESNRITSQWKQIEHPAKSAAESQALLELTTKYCDYKRCLECAIGKTILDSG